MAASIVGVIRALAARDRLLSALPYSKNEYSTLIGKETKSP